MQEYLIAVLVGLIVAAVACGMFALVHKELDDKRNAQMVIQQYIDWLQHEFPETGRVLENLKAEINGEALNSGTPLWNDNCVISGLRQQLRSRAVYAKESAEFSKYYGINHDACFVDETVTSMNDPASAPHSWPSVVSIPVDVSVEGAQR